VTTAEPAGIRPDLARVLDGLPDGVAVLDAEARFVWVNRRFTDLTGWDIELLAGRNGLDLVDPEQLTEAILALSIATEDAQTLAPGAYRLEHRDGGYVTLELHGAPIDGDSGAPMAIVVRPIEYQAVLTDGIELLNAGGPIEDMAGYLVERIPWTVADIAIVFDDDKTGDRRSVSAALHPPLDASVAVDDGVAPWDEAEATGEAVHRTLDELPPSLRLAAAERGYVACSAEAVPDPAGRPALFVLWFNEGAPPSYRFLFREEPRYLFLRLALERRHYETALRRAAAEDHLTGVANRAMFFDTIEGHPPTDRTAVLYVDLDDFKPINDTHGHAVGDAVLTEVARRLRSVVRPNDLVARLGGDEFAVFCTEVVTEATVEALAARVRRAMSEPVAIGDVRVGVGVSIGAAIAASPGADPDRLLEAADRALYEVKREGKAGWRSTLVG
jgi:diguanylate cyclase (GGDEF)-like protein/PAS domain S-box-containing protein